LQVCLPAISPRSPVKAATMIPGTSSPALYLEASKAYFSLSRIQYGGPGVFPLSANFGLFLSSLTRKMPSPAVEFAHSYFSPSFSTIRR
jgi:hypothetical protein